MKYKQLKICITIIGLISPNCIAQQNPTNNNPSGIPSGTDDKQFWS